MSQAVNATYPFNFGDVLEGLETALPESADALVELDGEQARRLTWRDLGRRTNNLGHAMRAAGAVEGDKVACYMRNSNAYMETVAACFKARLTPVNVNYRYRAAELFYIIDNSDAVVVVYAAEFRDLVEEIQPRLTDVRLWLEVADSNAAGQPPAAGQRTPDFAESYEAAAENKAHGGASLGLERSSGDLLFVYTGGTTGYPKGVMWEHGPLWFNLCRNSQASQHKTVVEHVQRTAKRRTRLRLLPACPMMHGTGLFSAINALLSGGCVVSTRGLRFDPIEFWDAVQREKVTLAAIVGDAFAKPMLEALRQHANRWDLSCLTNILSSGTMFSPRLKEELIQFLPQLQIADTFGSSEGLGFGASSSSKEESTQSAQFTINPNAKVFDEDHKLVEPGSGQVGFIATTGAIPLGYYKDEAKTAKTFPVIDGVRYSMPGDYCRVEADGTIILLGRGSGCINSAGEKIYAEEVEETLKAHANIDDALVFGIDDDKWGQAVTAVVHAENPALFDEGQLQQFVREALAAYKVPKRIFATDDMGRAPNGKANYAHVKDYALEQIARQKS